MTAIAMSLVLAMALRLLGALLRPVWVDEAATAIFSSGNSSWSTPMNTLVPLHDFVTALQLQAPGQLAAALGHLAAEDNHPPLHVGLSFLTAQLLQAQGSVLQPLTARLPAVVAGSLAVPLLSRAVATATGDARTARLAGLWIALSPLAVAMGLEARHYALATTLVCGALWALAEAWQRQRQRQPLPLPLQAAWLAVNALGLLTHHLFVVCIAAQVLTVVVLESLACRQLRWPLQASVAPALALLIGLAWFALGSKGGAPDQTAWLALDPTAPGQWLLMPLQLLVTALTGVLAPGTSLMAPWQWLFVVAAGAATLLGLVCLVRLAIPSGPAPSLLLVYTLSSAAMLLAASVISGNDFTRALRYGFVLLPGVLALVAVATRQAQVRGLRRSAAGLLGCSLICSFGVATGVALPASYNPQLLINDVNGQSRDPVLLVFNDRLVEGERPLIGYEGLSIAWHLDSRNSLDLRRSGQQPRLMLLSGDTSQRLRGLAVLEGIQGPVDLWIVNAYGAGSLTLQRQDCRHQRYASAGGHLHDHYHCGSTP